MMVRVLIYSYCRGVASSRRIERATYEDVAFRYLAADKHPDHDAIAAFRQEQLTPLAQLFVQVLQLCQRAGRVKLGHLAREQEAKEAAEKKQAEVAAQLKEREKQEWERGRKFGGRPPQAPDAEAAKPEPKAQRNFTDPESRIMKDGATKEFVQAYKKSLRW